MTIPLSNARAGVFVDGQNISLNGGHGMRYDVLREFATRDGAEAVRMNVYLAWDEERAAEDHGYRRGQDNFAATLRDFGYKVVRKRVRRFTDESGNRVTTTKTDVAMAVDLLLQSENLERILILTGDEDFVEVVRALQNRGCRVEVIGFDGVSPSLRGEADMFLSGYLIPNLLPIPQQDRDAWGKIGSRVRGVCYNHSGKGYGFLRYVREAAPGLWITDSRHPDSPYETVFFHDSQLPGNVAFHQLPSRELIFEFDLTESDRFENDLQAINLRLVSGVGKGRPVEPREEERADRSNGTDDAEWEDEEAEPAAETADAGEYEDEEEEYEEEVPDRP